MSHFLPINTIPGLLPTYLQDSLIPHYVHFFDLSLFGCRPSLIDRVRSIYFLMSTTSSSTTRWEKFIFWSLCFFLLFHVNWVTPERLSKQSNYLQDEQTSVRNPTGNISTVVAKMQCKLFAYKLWANWKTATASKTLINESTSGSIPCQRKRLNEGNKEQDNKIETINVLSLYKL